MNNPENNKKANTVCWLDVVIFEDNTFAVEIYYVDIVKEFREQFNKHTFTTIEELDNFFGDTDAIYDCDSYNKYITAKYNRPYKALLLDSVSLSSELLERIKEECDLAKCGGFINGMQY